LQQGKSSQVNIHGNNYEVNIKRTHNAQSGIDIGNGGNANHPREMTIDMCNNEPLNKFCWLSISTMRKWEKAPETDVLIALGRIEIERARLIGKEPRNCMITSVSFIWTIL
jgi:hypothetical protein